MSQPNYRYQIVTDCEGLGGTARTWNEARRQAKWAASDTSFQWVKIFDSMARKGRTELWRIVGGEPVAEKVKQ